MNMNQLNVPQQGTTFTNVVCSAIRMNSKNTQIFSYHYCWSFKAIDVSDFSLFTNQTFIDRFSPD